MQARRSSRRPSTIALDLGRACIQLRDQNRWTQRYLAERAGVSQAAVWRIESGQADGVDLRVVASVFAALGGTLEVGVRGPVQLEPRPRGRAHGRLIGYVARRLEGDGWRVGTEVEIRTGRAIGWIDVLAYRPADAACFAAELKTDLPDVGAAQRQVQWYSREAFAAARSLGWQPRTATGLLLVLDTQRAANVIRDNADLFRSAFPARARQLRDWIRTPGVAAPPPGLALIDPLSRRDEWLLSTAQDGRRTPARYVDYAAFMRAAQQRTAGHRAA